MKECHDNPGVKFLNGTTISKRYLKFVFEQAPMIQDPVFKKHDRPRTKSQQIIHTNQKQTPTYQQTYICTNLQAYNPITLPYSTVHYKPTNLQKTENSETYGLGMKDNRPSSKGSKILVLVIKTNKNQFRA